MRSQKVKLTELHTYVRWNGFSDEVKIGTTKDPISTMVRYGAVVSVTHDNGFKYRQAKEYIGLIKGDVVKELTKGLRKPFDDKGSKTRFVIDHDFITKYYKFKNIVYDYMDSDNGMYLWETSGIMLEKYTLDAAIHMEECLPQFFARVNDYVDRDVTYTSIDDLVKKVNVLNKTS